MIKKPLIVFVLNNWQHVIHRLHRIHYTLDSTTISVEMFFYYSFCCSVAIAVRPQVILQITYRICWQKKPKFVEFFLSFPVRERR